MKKYVPLALGFLIVASLSWWFISSSSKDPILKEYERKIDRYLPMYLAEIGDSVPAEQFRPLLLLGSLGKVPGVDFTIQQPQTEDGQITYWYFHEDRYDEVPELLNCSDYSGTTALRCMNTKFKAGADADSVLEEVYSVEPQTYEEIYMKLLIFENARAWEIPLGKIRSEACNKFLQIYVAEEPENLCVARYRARLWYHCFNSGPDYERIASQEPHNVDDFACYYISYLDYKKNVLGVLEDKYS
jgi:hypothetical protein